MVNKPDSYRALGPVAPVSVGRGRSELQGVLMLLAVAVAFHD
jgi:hypothetical protein